MRNPVIRIMAAAPMLAAIPVAAPAAAQTLPGLDNFTIERPAPPPVVTPSATPSPTASPTPATPTPAPTPTATSATTSPAPTASATPVPRTAPSPTATQAPTSTPPSSATPAATETLTPPPAEFPEASATRDLPAEQPADTVSRGGSHWPIWLLALLGLAGLLGAGWWWFKRPSRGDVGAEPASVAQPEAAAPPMLDPLPDPTPALPPDQPAEQPVTASATPAGLVTTSAPKVPGGLVTTAFRPELAFQLTPIRAGIDTLRATLEFSLVIGNEGRGVAHDVMVEAWLLAADRDPRGVIAELLAQDPGPPVLAPFALPAGAAIDVSGQVATPRDQLATITAGERKLFVPMLVVRAIWHDGRSQRDGAGAAFMVGVPREGQDRLAPLPLDRGARGYTTLAALRFDG